MPETQTLPEMVRAKYPGQYDDLPDAELDARIRAKYPGVYDDFAKPSPSSSLMRAWMQAHPKTRQVLKGTLDTLPVAGAMIGGALSTPETVGAGTIPGIALGTGVGRGARDLIAESIGVEDVTSPLSKAARIALDTAVAAVMPAVATRVRQIIAAPKATLADVLEGVSHPAKTSQKVLDELTTYLRGTPKVLPIAPSSSLMDSGIVDPYAPNVSGYQPPIALTAEQVAAQAASGHGLPSSAAPAPIVSGPQGVPARALAPDASVRAATMRAATASADPARDVAVVKTLIANGVPPAAAVRQVAGNSPQRYGSLMTLYLRSRQAQ